MSTKHEETLERLKTKAQEEETGEDRDLEFEPDDGFGSALSPQETEVEEEKKSSTREYVVLASWKEVARIEASSAEAALKALGKGEGDFAVVPLRNFNSFSVKTEQTTVTHVTPQ